MLCPKCSSDELKVLDTRAGNMASTRRRRECLKCNHRFSTIEEVLREDLVVVKGMEGEKASIGQNWQWVCEEPLPSAIDAEQINALLSKHCVESRMSSTVKFPV